MLKPPMPGMTDTLEFVKNLWGGMQIPGTMPGMPQTGMPPMPGAGLSVEDLDKKIADLKAVESWLNLNLGMLRGSIQALEIQRGTLATLKAMGDSVAQAMGQGGAAGDAAMAPFAQFFTQAAQAPGKPAAPETARPAQADPAPLASQAQPPERPTAQSGADAPNAMPAAVAWWNLLQEQFRQVVVKAMPADGGADPGQAGGAPPDVPGGAPAGAAANGAAAPAGGNAAPGAAPPAARRGARGKAEKS